MRAVILGVALAMAAGSVMAAEQATTPAAADEGSKMVCKSVSQPNTRFKKKECHTQDYWEAVSKVSREEFGKVQNNAGVPSKSN